MNENERKQEFDYVELQLDFKRYLGVKKRVYFGFGGFIGVLTRAHSKVYSDNWIILEEYPIDEFFRKVNYGLSTSIGYVIPINRNILLRTELTNIRGIRVINTPDYNFSTFSYDFKTNNLSLLISLSFLHD